MTTSERMFDTKVTTSERAYITHIKSGYYGLRLIFRTEDCGDGEVWGASLLYSAIKEVIYTNARDFSHANKLQRN